MKVIREATRPENWVQDIIRHTSISFQLDRDKDEPLVAFNCGTSAQVAQLIGVKDQHSIALY